MIRCPNRVSDVRTDVARGHPPANACVLADASGARPASRVRRQAPTRTEQAACSLVITQAVTLPPGLTAATAPQTCSSGPRPCSPVAGQVPEHLRYQLITRYLPGRSDLVRRSGPVGKDFSTSGLAWRLSILT